MRRLVEAGLLAFVLAGPAHAAPDARRGEQVYVRCQACHALTFDRVGPRHCGLIGRTAGSVAGFEYSAAMKKSHIVWNEGRTTLELVAFQVLPAGAPRRIDQSAP